MNQQVQDAIDAAAAAAVAAGNPGNKARITLRAFDGKGDAQDTRDFLDKVDGYRAVARLTDEETAQAVAFTIVPNSEAALWLMQQKERDAASTATWGALRPLMEERFSPPLTPSQRAALAESCKQRKGEGVRPFMDRCCVAQQGIDRVIPANERQGNAYLLRFDNAALQLFLTGLREEGQMKAHVNASTANTRLEFLAEAVRYEVHVTKQVKAVVVAELAEDGEEEGDDDDAEVAAIQPKGKGKKKNKKKGSGGGGNGGAQAGKGGGKSGGGQQQQQQQRGTQGGARGGGGDAKLCWTCQSADHLSYRCPQKKEGGGGNRGGGGNQRGSGGGATVDAPGINEMLGRYFVEHMMRGNPAAQGALESLQYQGPSGNPGGLQGFY